MHFVARNTNQLRQILRKLQVICRHEARGLRVEGLGGILWGQMLYPLSKVGLGKMPPENCQSLTL